MNHCDETCQAYLVDSSGSRLLLPSDYDTGIDGLVFSPDCGHFMVFASYDGPDYSRYYDSRAQIFGFRSGNAKSSNAIQPLFKIYFRDFTIADLIWESSSGLALKVYEGRRPSASEENSYRYFRVDLDL